MKKIKVISAIGFALSVIGCGGGGSVSAPCASEAEISQALLSSTLQWQGSLHRVNQISDQVIAFDNSMFSVTPGQTIQIQANITVPQACQSGLRFSWGRTGNGSTRMDPQWLDVDPTTGLIHGVVPIDVGNYSIGGSLAEVKLPGAQLRFLNFGINVSP